MSNIGAVAAVGTGAVGPTGEVVAGARSVELAGIAGVARSAVAIGAGGSERREGKAGSTLPSDESDFGISHEMGGN